MDAPGELAASGPAPIRVLAAVELGLRATFGDRMLLGLVAVRLAYGIAMPDGDVPGLGSRGPWGDAVDGVIATFVSGCVFARVLDLAPGWQGVAALVLARFGRLLVPFLILTLIMLPLLALDWPEDPDVFSPMLMVGPIVVALVLLFSLRWGMYEAVVLREDRGAREALARSWWLTGNGNWLRILVVWLVFAGVLGVLFTVLGGLVGLAGLAGVTETVEALSAATIEVALSAAIAVAYAQVADSES
jgi:hypothetical protein